ncbi:cx9C motif-containing protein 4 [Dermatophagoides farinae]|uniref:Cx9c motif-containing protein 4 n=1 Tax=Dermatophagoides farinae TaxID=6954 RepID=A0A922HN86_DERFA|nr:cx9c motif-containing protein 4 [Dermatophagoides farinae]KAH9491324.1 Cx9C motif-containing protein 4, mitochondrial [Dermatophagoides farinae]
MSGQKRDPCVKFSCILEKCTRINNYQADKCAKELEQMLDCCRKFGRKLSPSCEGFHELDEHFEKMEQQQQQQRQQRK